MDHEQCFVVPFHIFMTSDLAFFTLILGKGLSSTSCYSCNLMSAEWKLPSHEKCMAWTLDLIIETCQQLTEWNRIIEGVKRLPLLTMLEVDWFLPPTTMHIILGIGNYLLDNCLKFLDMLIGLENMLEAIHQGWQKFYDILAIKMDVKQEMDAWVACWGPEIVCFHKARSAFNHVVNSQKCNSLTPKQHQEAKSSWQHWSHSWWKIGRK